MARQRRLSPSDVDRIVTRSPLKTGRSKEIFKVDDHLCLVRLKPSLRSYTFGRDENVPGTDSLRLDFYELASRRLKERGLACAFVERVSPVSYLAELCEDSLFETIVKNRAVGSTLRYYPGLFREGHEFRTPVVKFDYRREPEDLPIADDYLRAAGYDPDLLKRIALQTNEALQEWLAPCELWDFCLVIGRDRQGKETIISEVSPDCMRLRAPSGASLDKDLFRQGQAGERIVTSWRYLVESVRGKNE